MTTIIFAREDLTIPGAAGDILPASGPSGSSQAHFFDLIRRSTPDVIVLDFSNAAAEAGSNTILAVRQQTDIPILVVCNSGQPLAADFRIAGAADCISTPVDLIKLNQAIQRIVRATGRSRSVPSRAPANVTFAAMSFYPGRNLLAGEGDSTAELTSSEGRLLAHFVSKPWTLCTRSEIGELLYGREHSVGERAIDIIVNRLRKKLVSIGGADAEQLIKTEFRRGYLLVADVRALARPLPERPRADLASPG